MESFRESSGAVDSLIRSRLRDITALTEFSNGVISRECLQEAITEQKPEDWGVNEDQLNLATRLAVDEESMVDELLKQLHTTNVITGADYDREKFDRYRSRVAAKFQHEGNATYIFPEEARLLYAVAEIMAPSRVLFMGSYYGYWAAWALPGIVAAGGEAILIDPDQRALDLSVDNMRRLGYADFCTFVCEDAIAYLERNRALCDLAVLDAEGPISEGPVDRRSKAIYGPITSALTPRLRAGGVLLAHNILLTNLTDNAYFEQKIAKNCEQFAEFFGLVARHYDRALTFPTSEGVGVYRRATETGTGASSTGAGSMPSRHMQRERWHRTATVRTRPQRIWKQEDSDGHLVFSTKQIPVAAHPLLLDRLDEANWENLHTQHFYRFMAFTIRLEQYVVNPAVLAIAHRDVPLKVRGQDAYEAHQIYVDEGYHALEAVELTRDVHQGTGTEPIVGRGVEIDRRLEELLAGLPCDRTRALARQLFVAVSETMISSTLSIIPRDESVARAVRAAIADHAVDEGRHHSFFAGYLPQLWQQLAPKEQDLLAPFLPRFIMEFTAPDVEGLRRELVGYGLTSCEVDDICHDVYSPSRLREDASIAGGATLRYLERCGALDRSCLSDALGAAGLVS
ncbi:diiron oxygenase [Streptomyces sp. bgisy130]|uniref:diiron oxygenase n=1 Tax=Streptomyces sp. bgisy130 TaxID=3413788 RepID=UPI003F4A37BC